MINFLVAHKALVLGVMVAVLDLVFALSPGLQSNGVLHSLYLLVAPKPPVPPAE